MHTRKRGKRWDGTWWHLGMTKKSLVSPEDGVREIGVKQNSSSLPAEEIEYNCLIYCDL